MHFYLFLYASEVTPFFKKNAIHEMELFLAGKEPKPKKTKLKTLKA